MRWSWRLPLIYLAVAVCGVVVAFAYMDRPVESDSVARMGTTPAADAWIAPIPTTLELDPRKVALGEHLFHDSKLSRDETIACAGCHSLAQGGADGRARSIGIDQQVVDRNAPTVFNSAFNFRQFWDGRAESLEAQVDGPLHSAKEMGASWAIVLPRLTQDPYYARELASIYSDGVTAANVRDAIATYERSLTTPNSRLDRYLKGERRALAKEEVRGYELFRNYGCVACHQGVNVGGNLYARLGAVVPYYTDVNPAKPTDLGRFNLTGNPQDRHLFKVPSLRNVALTAPYFHDGSVRTLDEAVEIMARHQLGIALPPEDVAALVRFLQTLTGEYKVASR